MRFAAPSGEPLCFRVNPWVNPPPPRALLVDGGEYFANAGDDLYAVGSLDPIVRGYVGCIVIRPDKTRVLARAVRDPLA